MKTTNTSPRSNSGGTHAGSSGSRTYTSQPLLDPRKRLQPSRARRNGDLGMKTVIALTVPSYKAPRAKSVSRTF